MQDLGPRTGDAMELRSDGMQEREPETADLPSLIRERAIEHPREVVRTLVAGAFPPRQLRDDATVLCLDWHAPRCGGRRANAGAS
ncbi:hypothetical protein ACW4TU_44305 [Streptomyces sp. QTS52]